ncbi:MAG: hypothetical protein ACOY71_11410 [Gemmatimonadota bacterium]
MRPGERGVALPIALFALVVIGALVAGTFFTGRLDQRSGANTAFAEQAGAAAEAGLEATIAGWQPATFNALAADQDLVLAPVSIGGGVTYQATLTRLNGQVFLVRSEGRRLAADGTLLARRHVGLIARLTAPPFDPPAGLAILGALNLGGSAAISGIDQVPGGWSARCGGAGPDAAGIASNVNGVNATGSCAGLGCVTGSPKLQVTPALDTTALYVLGGVSVAALAAQASKVMTGTVTLTPRLAGGTCDVVVAGNWGEPWAGGGLAPCFDFFPVIHAPGNLRLGGGRGQGLLLVDGDLELAGGVEFYGLAVVRGSLRTVGSGGSIIGAALVANGSGGPSAVAGNATLQRSTCAVRRALAGAAMALPTRERSWAQLYD